MIVCARGLSPQELAASPEAATSPPSRSPFLRVAPARRRLLTKRSQPNTQLVQRTLLTTQFFRRHGRKKKKKRARVNSAAGEARLLFGEERERPPGAFFCFGTSAVAREREITVATPHRKRNGHARQRRGAPSQASPAVGVGRRACFVSPDRMRARTHGPARLKSAAREKKARIRTRTKA